MGVLQRFERRLEGLVQGAFTRAFGGWVEPVEVAAALTREAEDRKAIVAAGRVLVPNRYTVELGPADNDRLKEYDEPLRQELATMVTEAAQERGWSFVGPVEVLFHEVSDLDTGAFRIRSAVEASERPVDAAAAVPEPASEGPHLELGTTRYPLAGTTVIGRAPDVDVRLTDTGVSRRHARLVTGPDGTEISDLGSTNGTLVNGSPASRTMLRDGDLVTVGTIELVYRSGR